MKILVVGASGNIGRGVVGACLDRGWSVVAVARGEAGLSDLAAHHPSADLRTLVGSLDTEKAAVELATDAGVDQADAVVVAIGGPWSPRPVDDCSWSTVVEPFFAQSLRPHVNAASVLIPRLRDGATYLAVGGAMADFIVPGTAPISMAEAALRNLIRSWHKEYRSSSVAIRELTIASMVNGHHTRERAEPSWLTDTEIGQHAAAILSDPQGHPGPILSLSRKDL